MTTATDSRIIGKYVDSTMFVNPHPKTAYFFSAQARQEAYGGGKMWGTECEHAHRTVVTASKCAHKRNPTQAPGTLKVDVFRMNTDGRYDDWYGGLSEEARWAALDEIDAAINPRH